VTEQSPRPIVWAEHRVLRHVVIQALVRGLQMHRERIDLVSQRLRSITSPCRVIMRAWRSRGRSVYLSTVIAPQTLGA
jgi:hypothetical protein